MTTQPVSSSSRPAPQVAPAQPATGGAGLRRLAGRPSRRVAIAGGVWAAGAVLMGSFQFYSLEASRSLWLKVQAPAAGTAGVSWATEQALDDITSLQWQGGGLGLAVLVAGIAASWWARSARAGKTAPRQAARGPSQTAADADAAVWGAPQAQHGVRSRNAAAFMPLADEPSPAEAGTSSSAAWGVDALLGGPAPHLSADPALVVPPSPPSVALPPGAFQPSDPAADRAWLTPSRPLVQSEVVHHAVIVAQRGGEVVSRVVANMEDIAASSRKINEVLSTIDSIAVQTNILALNAAVQSARARQEGRSGGDVAGEVRLLAQRAASAAKEIKTLINASAEKAEFGDRLVRDAGTTMDAMVSSVQSVTDLVGQIATAEAGEGRSVALLQVDVSVQRLDDLTRQHQGLVEQSTAAAESLRVQAERLQKVVGAFRLLQQTQEAAWEAHTVIHTVRASARAETRPGGLDDLGNNGKPGGDWASF
jgi:Methyl-accepting chemotaxis protein (MCP) signalling domain